MAVDEKSALVAHRAASESCLVLRDLVILGRYSRAIGRVRMTFVPSGIGIDECIVLVSGAHRAVCVLPRDAGEFSGFTSDLHGWTEWLARARGEARGAARPLTVRRDGSDYFA
jgi:hypothetical protein